MRGILMKNRLAIGTVQFGMPYGIANQGVPVSLDETNAILAHAWSQGIEMLDTAISYGESEKRLGQIGVGSWKNISKLPDVPHSCSNIKDWVNKSVIASLNDLEVNCLYGILLHRTHQLLGDQGENIYAALLELKELGLVEKVGISISEIDELDAILPNYRFDLIQIPFNIIDRRLTTSGWLPRLKKMGIEIHVRSVFLQGLLLMDINKHPYYFKRWEKLWQYWKLWLDEQNITPLQACLNFVLGHLEIDRIVIGVHNLRQLQEILDIKPIAINPPKILTSEDLDLINPSRWSLH